MVEMGIGGQGSATHPVHGLACIEGTVRVGCCMHGQQARVACQDVPMAIQAGRGGRHACLHSFFGKGVAALAGHGGFACVRGMGKGMGKSLPGGMRAACLHDKGKRQKSGCGWGSKQGKEKKRPQRLVLFRFAGHGTKRACLRKIHRHAIVMFRGRQNIKPCLSLTYLPFWTVTGAGAGSVG